MGYIYVYQLITRSGTVIKVGHGKINPKSRMNDYIKTYGLNVDTSSLLFKKVSNSSQAEKYVHQELIKSGFRNIKDGNYGPQEIFQAPELVSYKEAAKLVITLSKRWENHYASFQYSASDLVRGKYKRSNLQSPSKLNQTIYGSISKNIFSFLYRCLLYVLRTFISFIFFSTATFVITLVILFFCYAELLRNEYFLGGHVLMFIILFYTLRVFRKRRK